MLIRNAKANKRNPIVKGLGGRRRVFIAALWASPLLREAFYGGLMLPKHLIKVGRDRRKGLCVPFPKGEFYLDNKFNKQPAIANMRPNTGEHLSQSNPILQPELRVGCLVLAKVRLVLPKHPLIAAVCLLGGPCLVLVQAMKTHKAGQMGVRGPLRRRDHRLANKETAPGNCLC